MTDHEIAMKYLPLVYFDDNETIPLRAIGYTVARETQPSLSFFKRGLDVPKGAMCTIEYAYYWDYDIGHMYDLEHIWVVVAEDGSIMDARGSFHGFYMNLYVPGMPTFVEPKDHRIVAFCQPGKHAFLADGQAFRMVPFWNEVCNVMSGGPVLIGNPFSAQHSGTGKPLFTPSEQDNANSTRYLKETYSFQPAMTFNKTMPESVEILPWTELFRKIPVWVNAECEKLAVLYGTGR